MANPFDQFDAAPTAATSNPFDQFDEKPSALTPESMAADQQRRQQEGEADPEAGRRLGAFVRGAAEGAAPALLGGIPGAGFGMATVAPLAGAVAAVPVVGPALAGGVELAGGAVGGFGGAAAVGAAQKWVLDHAPNGVVKALGLDAETQAADEKDHPNYRFAGQLAPNLAAFRPGAMGDVADEAVTTAQKLMRNPVTARALPAAVMGAQEAATEEVQQGDLDPSKIAIAAGVGAMSNKMTKIGDFLTGAGAGPVLGLQAALRNRGKGGQVDAAGMRDITPEKPGPAPAGTPQISAPIDPVDIHPGDDESPIPTSIIAAGRKIVREATTPIDQAPANYDILARNGWPQQGSRVTLDDGEGPPMAGTVQGGFSTDHPDVPGTQADGLHVTLDSGHMFTAFKHELDAAGISITPQQLQTAGLPTDLASNAPADGPSQPVTATASVSAPAVPEQVAPVQAPSPSVTPMPADLFQAPRTVAPAEVTAPAATEVSSAAAAPPTTGDGTQAAPIAVSHPDHLTAAESVVNTAPTDAQKEAGNYAKGHIKLHGMDIAIENPKGSERSGVGSDGAPWSVKMPASYGYVKRTTGADGEQVDVYIGPNPKSSKVFVIDQKDAHTGAFDEHKSMLGFDTKEQAVAAYHAAFDDGLGPQRLQGVREMHTLAFKKLLNSGVLDKPVAGASETVEKINSPAAAPVQSFTTARGSHYEVHADGTTTRTKAARADVGHEGDSGVKPRTAKTIYVDDPKFASALSAAGLENLGSKGARVIIKDGKASMLTWNEAAGRWGVSPQSKDIPISTAPAVGKTPLELWKPADDVPGYEAYRGMHAGNAITSVGGEAPPVAETSTPASTSTVHQEPTQRKPLVKAARAPLLPTRETSVLENIRRMGGIKTVDGLGRTTKEGQDIQAVLKDVNRPGLINNKTGKRPDAIREHMKERGWFAGNPEHGADIQHLYDLIEKEVRDGPQFHPESVRGKAVAEKAVAEKAVADENARALADVHDEAKKGGGELTADEADEVVAHMGAHGIDPESAVADFLERKAMRGVYEDNHAEATHPDHAEAEPDNSGAGEADSGPRKVSEEPAPVAGDEGGAGEAGHPDQADSGEAQPVVKGADEPNIPALAHGVGSWMIVDRVTGKVITELFKDSKAIKAINFEKYKAVPADEYLAGLNKPKELPTERDADGRDQTIVPGSEPSAKQLAQAREDAGKGRASTKVEQKDAGGLFEPKAEQPKDLFAEPPVNASQIDTPEFKKWFGDSKVVDDAGKPVAVFHGTPHADIEMFDTYASNYGLMGQGSYFTEDPDIASSYTSKGAARMERRGETAAPTVYKAYLSIKNPLDMEAPADRAAWSKAFGDNFEMFDELKPSATNEDAYRNVEEGLRDDADLPLYEGAEMMQGGIASMGHDGITHIGGGRATDSEVRHRVWIVFEPEQVKSATGNSGAFDATKADIRLSRQPGEYNTENQTADIKGAKYEVDAPQSAELEARREAVANDLREAMDKLGLHDVGLKVADQIFPMIDGKRTGSAGGMYWQDIITVALDARNGVIPTLNHEAIHALKVMGLFTKSEWSILTAKARSTWRAKYDIDARYAADANAEGRLDEEAIAEAFREYQTGSDKGVIGRLFDRLRDFIAAIGRALRGHGFTKPDDIFERVASGEVGARERPNGEAGHTGEVSFSREGDEAAPADEKQAAMDNAWDGLIKASAEKLGWHGEPTSNAMFMAALRTPKGPAKTELTRSAGLIKAMEDQRAAIFKTPVTPIRGTGETKVRGLAQHIEDKAVRAKLADSFGSLPEYQQVNMKDQAARASKFLEQNYEAAKAVAMGTEPPPHNILPESILVAVENRAIKEGDTETLRQLATNSALNVEATTMGQRIRTLGERDPTSPVAAIKAVNDARQAAAKAKGVDPKKAKGSAVKDMLDAIKKETDKSAKRMNWETFIHSITCDSSGGPK